MVCMYSNTLAPDPFFDIVSSLSSSRDWRLLAPRNASSITACIIEKIQYFCYGFGGHYFAQLTTTTLKRIQPTTIMYEPRKNAGPLSNCTNSSPFSPYLPSSSKCLSVLHWSQTWIDYCHRVWEGDVCSLEVQCSCVLRGLYAYASIGAGPSYSSSFDLPLIAKTTVCHESPVITCRSRCVCNTFGQKYSFPISTCF